MSDRDRKIIESQKAYIEELRERNTQLVRLDIHEGDSFGGEESLVPTYDADTFRALFTSSFFEDNIQRIIPPTHTFSDTCIVRDR